MQFKMSVKPIFFALDGKSIDEFEFELKRLEGHIYGVKVGLELFISEGPSVVEKLKKQGWKVFLDLKLHDIPNTVKEATKSAGNLGVDYLTIHISSGLKTLKMCKNISGRTKLVGVTILTSLDNKALREIGFNRRVEKIVAHQARLARRANLDAIVCSAHEVKVVKKIFKKEIITPGIRLDSKVIIYF